MKAPKPHSRARLIPLGEISPALATELAPHLDLGVHGGEGPRALFDGAHPINRSALHEALTSRRSVTIVHPSEEHARDLFALTGARVDSAVDAVTYTRTARGYSVRPLPRRSQEHRAERSLGPRIADDTIYPLEPAVPTPSAMFANLGSLAGYISYSVPSPLLVMPPDYDGVSDDTYVTTSQTGDAPFVVTFFVYYVNGVTTPYFVVFASLIGISMNNAMANGDINLGWMRPAIEPYLSGPNAAITFSPGSGDATNGINAQLTDSFVLLDQNGDAYQMNPSIGQTLSYPAWSIAQSASTDGQSCWWNIFQSTPWNAYLYPAWDDSSWIATNNIVFNEDWLLMQQTDLAMGHVSYQVLGKWYVATTTPQTPPFTTAPSTPFAWDAEVKITWALAHNEKGCSGSCGSTGNHFFAQQYANELTGTIDLGSIANSQNLTLPS